MAGHARMASTRSRRASPVPSLRRAPARVERSRTPAGRRWTADRARAIPPVTPASPARVSQECQERAFQRRQAPPAAIPPPATAACSSSDLGAMAAGRANPGLSSSVLHTPDAMAMPAPAPVAMMVTAFLSPTATRPASAWPMNHLDEACDQGGKWACPQWGERRRRNVPVVRSVRPQLMFLRVSCGAWLPHTHGIGTSRGQEAAAAARAGRKPPYRARYLMLGQSPPPLHARG
jgi:hypothetical protein